MRVKYIDDYNCVSIFTREEKENLEWLDNIDDNVNTMVQYIMGHSDVTDHIQKLANQTGNGNIAFSIGVKEDKDATMIAFHFVIVDESAEDNLRRFKMMQGERQIPCNGLEIDMRNEDYRSDINLDSFFDTQIRIRNIKEGLVHYFEENQKDVNDFSEEIQDVVYKSIVSDSVAEVIYMFLSKMAADEMVGDSVFKNLGEYYTGYLDKMLLDICRPLHIKVEDVDAEGDNPMFITDEHFIPIKENEIQKYLYSFSSLKALTDCVTAFHIKTDVYKDGDVYQMVLESPDELDRYMDFATTKVRFSDAMLEHKEQKFHSEFLSNFSKKTPSISLIW